MTAPRWQPRAEVRAVCVTGMHRSGTSLAMRVLQLLGIDLGRDDDLMPPGPDNRAGYWENRLVKEYDDELLAHLGGSWDRPPRLPPGWEQAPSLDPWRDRAAAILDRSFAAAGTTGATIGIKDPRLSLLLPFWRTVVPVATTVLVVRDPHEVVASLAQRNGFDRTHAALLWLRYTTAAVAADPTTLLLDHRAFFDDLSGAVDALVAHVGLAPPDADALERIAGHLDPSLRHHRRAPDAIPDPDPVVRMAETVWNDGAPSTRGLEPVLCDALAEGALVAPSSDDDVRAARAQATDMREQLRARNAKVKALTEHAEELTAQVRALRAGRPHGAPP